MRGLMSQSVDSQVLRAMSRPSSPDLTTRFIAWILGFKLQVWPQSMYTPCRSAAVTMRSASSMERAMGFSQTTCLPCSTAANTCWQWRLFGVATQTTSTSGSRTSSSTLVYTRASNRRWKVSSAGRRRSAAATSRTSSILASPGIAWPAPMPSPAIATLRTRLDSDWFAAVLVSLLAISPPYRARVVSIPRGTMRANGYGVKRATRGGLHMLTKEEAEAFSQVGAGTPMGELLRRYWHPIAAVGDLDEDSVRPVRLLGEDLVLFRDEAGRLGLLTDRCAHRGISMAYGIPQENGLRCAYHGWTYDPEGHVVDMPFEPMCIPFRITSYPVQELGGLIFAYLGPQPAPLLPRWDLLVRTDLQRSIELTPLPCSWLQCMDNSLDPIHYEHLHGVYGNYVMRKQGKKEPMLPARHLKIEFDVFEYGIFKRRLVEGAPEDSDDWTIGHPILFPNTLLVGDSTAVRYQIRVPVDDSHTLHINYNGLVVPNPSPEIPVKHTTLFEPDGRVIADTVVKQDMLAWVGQGPISDRTTEHLVTSDKGVQLYRRVLRENMDRVARGEDPMGVVRDPEINEPMIKVRWEEHAKEIFWPDGRRMEWRVPADTARPVNA